MILPLLRLARQAPDLLVIMLTERVSLSRAAEIQKERGRQNVRKVAAHLPLPVGKYEDEEPLRR